MFISHDLVGGLSPFTSTSPSHLVAVILAARHWHRLGLLVVPAKSLVGSATTVACDAGAAIKGHFFSRHATSSFSQLFAASIFSPPAFAHHYLTCFILSGLVSCVCHAMIQELSCWLIWFSSDLLGSSLSQIIGFASVVRSQSWKAFRPIRPAPHKLRPSLRLARCPSPAQATICQHLNPTVRMARSLFPTVSSSSSNRRSSKRTEMG